MNEDGPVYQMSEKMLFMRPGRDKTMQVKIAVWMCSHLLAEAVKRLLAEEISGCVLFNCTSSDDVICAKPKLLITDFKTLSDESFKPLLNFEARILLIETACMNLMIHEELYNLIGRGIAGILPQKCTVSQLKRAIRSVVSGELWLDRKSLSDVIKRITSDRLDQGPILSNTERRIVKMICRGFRNKEIMATLNTSEQAVKSHLSRIYKKIGISDRLQLAIYANKHWPDYLDET